MDCERRGKEGHRTSTKGPVLKAIWSILVAFAAFAQAAAAEFSVPPPSGPVVDLAQMLTPGDAAKLEAALRQLWQSGGSQIAVLTVPTLGGEPIEQASIKVTDQWKLGTTKGDNGVLLFIAKAERELRIEVGQGLEGVLPDAYARRIIDDVIVPRFRTGDVSSGIVAGVIKIASYTDPDRDLGLRSQRLSRVRNDRGGNFSGLPPFWLLIMLVIFASLFGRRRHQRFGYWGGGGWGGGGFSSGSGGSSWGGGGGGFSGGGASGKW